MLRRLTQPLRTAKDRTYARLHEATAPPPVELPPVRSLAPADDGVGADLDDDAWLRAAYNLVLEREPDDAGWEHYSSSLADGSLTRGDILDTMRFSMEYRYRMRPRDILASLHLSRCDFIRSFPRARRILDLGGTAQSDPAGAMVSMGYPYVFDELVIVDLPHDLRHDIYTYSAPIEQHLTALGMVRYRYHSMADLSAYDDGSFDLVYSGQTFEHVTESDGDKVLAEVFRVLRPGGWFYLDTPNGPVCRIQQAEFINPDHEVEYSHDEMMAKLDGAGFDVPVQLGLNWCGDAVASDSFSIESAAAFVGMYGTPAECYLLAYGARKPA